MISLITLELKSPYLFQWFNLTLNGHFKPNHIQLVLF